jgi:2-keto-3-deoxy-L-rhamnonate aldolase RhmA
MREGLRPRLGQGRPLLGAFIHLPAPAIVEMAGHSGYDFVIIDAEHGPQDVETCEHMVRAAETAGIVPIIRLPYPDPRLINRYLDTGAMGVLVPHIANAEVARAVVDAAKYHPLGHRGAGGRTRASNFGLTQSSVEYAAWANAETMVFGILEDAGLDQNLPEILEVEGFDGFVIGPSDLSQSLGLPGQTRHPKVLEAVDAISRQVLASGKVLCRPLQDAQRAPEEARDFAAMGVHMISEPFIGLFARGARDILSLRVDE